MSKRIQFDPWGPGLALAALFALTFALFGPPWAWGQPPFAWENALAKAVQAEAGPLGGTCPPPIPEGCGQGLPRECPYPGASATVTQQQQLAALLGPWHLDERLTPLPGMQESYPHGLAWWRDARDQPLTAFHQRYCLDPSACVLGTSVWYEVGKILKPCPGCGTQPCWAWTGNHAVAQQRWGEVYSPTPYSSPHGDQGRPTLSQWLSIECHRFLATGRWGVDSGVEAAGACAQAGGVQPTCTQGSPWQPEEFTARWNRAAWESWLRSPTGKQCADFDLDDVACWFELGQPGCAAGPPPEPDPPPPPLPDPDPEPDPPPVQTCQPGEECRPPCEPCPDCPPCPGYPEECGELADLVEIHDRQLASVRSMVDEACVAALPDGTWRQVDNGKFCKRAPAWLLRQVAKTEGLLLEAREECRGAEQRFVPGTPSTGRLEIELTERSEQ